MDQSHKNTNVNIDNQMNDYENNISLNLEKFFETDISRRLSIAEEKIEQLNAIFLDVCCNDRFNELIRSAADFRSLFSLLQSASRRYMVILSVRDTPGDYLPDIVLDAILKCGFTNFRKDLWYTYVGVVHKGKVLCNEGNFNEKKTSFCYSSLDGKFDLSVRSESWRNGDSGEIIINGKQLSCNLRGVNIVVYDITKSTAIISFALDSHEPKPPILKKI